MIGEVYEEITDSLHALEEMPHQLVHGDLNASNLLVMDSGHSQVAALLDFELCTLDVRVMEPAVILSGFLGQPEETKLKRRRRRLTLRREATHVGAGSERRIKAARTDRQERGNGPCGSSFVSTWRRGGSKRIPPEPEPGSVGEGGDGAMG